MFIVVSYGYLCGKNFSVFLTLFALSPIMPWFVLVFWDIFLNDLWEGFSLADGFKFFGISVIIQHVRTVRLPFFGVFCFNRGQ